MKLKVTVNCLEQSTVIKINKKYIIFILKHIILIPYIKQVVTNLTSTEYPSISISQKFSLRIFLKKGLYDEFPW